MRTRPTPKPTPKGCPECGAQETRGTVLHRPTCTKHFGSLALTDAAMRALEAATPAAIEAFAGAAHGVQLSGGSSKDIVPGSRWDYCPYCGNHPELNADHREAVGLVGLTPDEMDAASLGRKGGQSRASHLSPEQRSESARKAAKARWGKADV